LFGVVLALVLAAVCGLELWYWSLLPSELPSVSTSSYPPLIRNTIWLYQCSGKGEPRLRPIFPFLVGFLLHEPSPETRLSGSVARHLVKFGAGERQFKRVLREIALATWISRHWTVDHALDTYASEAWTGDHRRGIREAASALYDKEVGSLSVDEVALLVAMTRAPSRLSPLCHPDRARQARDELLGRMKEAGLLDAQELSRATSADLGVRGTCQSPR